MASLANVMTPGISFAVSATLKHLQGLVQVQHAGKGSWETVKDTLPIEEGDRLKTDADSTAFLVLPDDHRVAIGPDTYLVLQRVASGETKLYLKNGAIRNKVRHLNLDLGQYYKVQTPTAVCAVRGTDFAVLQTLAQTTANIRVYEGLVDLSALKKEIANQVMHLTAGQGTVVDPTGHIQMTVPSSPQGSSPQNNGGKALAPASNSPSTGSPQTQKEPPPPGSGPGGASPGLPGPSGNTNPVGESGVHRPASGQGAPAMDSNGLMNMNGGAINMNGTTTPGPGMPVWTNDWFEHPEKIDPKTFNSGIFFAPPAGPYSQTFSGPGTPMPPSGTNSGTNSATAGATNTTPGQTTPSEPTSATTPPPTTTTTPPPTTATTPPPTTTTTPPPTTATTPPPTTATTPPPTTTTTPPPITTTYPTGNGTTSTSGTDPIAAGNSALFATIQNQNLNNQLQGLLVAGLFNDGSVKLSPVDGQYHLYADAIQQNGSNGIKFFNATMQYNQPGTLNYQIASLSFNQPINFSAYTAWTQTAWQGPPGAGTSLPIMPSYFVTSFDNYRSNTVDYVDAQGQGGYLLLNLASNRYQTVFNQSQATVNGTVLWKNNNGVHSYLGGVAPIVNYPAGSSAIANVGINNTYPYLVNGQQVYLGRNVVYFDNNSGAVANLYTVPSGMSPMSYFSGTNLSVQDTLYSNLFTKGPIVSFGSAQSRLFGGIDSILNDADANSILNGSPGVGLPSGVLLLNGSYY